VWRGCRDESWLRAPATRLSLLIVVQVLLGLGTWVAKYGFPGWMSGFEFAAAYRPTADSVGQVVMATAHVAIGSLILATSTLLAMRAWRLGWVAAPVTSKPEPVRRSTNTPKLLMEVAR